MQWSWKVWHQQLNPAGDTAPVESENVSYHFVCLSAVNGHVVEFDGARKNAPYSHGTIYSSALLCPT